MKRDMVTAPDRRAHYVAAGHWDGATLAGQVNRHAENRPDATAVVDGGGRYSYAQLRSDAAHLAEFLRSRGVGSESFVASQLPNRYEAAVVAVAVQSLGATINPLLPSYRLKELRHAFATAPPAAVFAPAVYRGFDHRPLIREALGESGASALQVVVGDGAERSELGFESALRETAAASTLAEAPAELVSELIFTSGTEARPKAVMHTEQTTCFAVRTAWNDLLLSSDDVVWMPSPVGHSTGFNYGLRFALYHGIPLVLQDAWRGDLAAQLVARERCSYTLAATTFLQDLTEAAARLDLRLDSLRYFGCGGAPVPPSLVDRAAQHGIRCLRLYGSTEVLVGTWNRPWSPLDKRRNSDGTPMSHVEIRIAGEHGEAMAPGNPGEIETRGPSTCVGFFRDPERTAATFTPDGWVRSGDIATLDAEGYLTVVARKKEIIIRGGLNIAPREIEEMLVAFPEVERAAVVGLPDERLGERMCACVVLRPGAALDFDTMVARLTRAGLARFKLPERLERVDALPATASGKIQKHEIVRMLTHG